MTLHAHASKRDHLIEEFNAVVAETEQLLKSVASAGSERAGAVRAGVEQGLAIATDRLRNLQLAATQKTQAAARATDDYVHDHPWQAIGIAASLNLVIGLAIVLLLQRR